MIDYSRRSEYKHPRKINYKRITDMDYIKSPVSFVLLLVCLVLLLWLYSII